MEQYEDPNVTLTTSVTEHQVTFEWRLTVTGAPGQSASSRIQAFGNTWSLHFDPEGGNKVLSEYILFVLRRIGPQKVVRVTIGVQRKGSPQQMVAVGETYPQDSSSFYVLTPLKWSDPWKGVVLTVFCRLCTDKQPAVTGENLFSFHSSSPATLRPTTSNSVARKPASLDLLSLDLPAFNASLSSCGNSSTVHPSLARSQAVSNNATRSVKLQDPLCPLRTKVPPSAKVDATLHRHLKDLLLSAADHDVTLRVQNQAFGAHKCMLRARSPVFAAMFRHDTRENACGSVSIDDCQPEAFGEFLNYVYTGRVEKLSPGRATGLYYAADKYDFPGLKEACVQYLEASLSANSICDVIDLATRHGENGLLEKATNFFSANVKHVLPSVGWQRFSANNFDFANELVLRAIEHLERAKK